MTEEELNERRRKRAALLLLPLLLLGAALCFWTLFASVSLGEAQSFIPAPLGSNALANYGEDDIPGRLRSLSISIVEAVIRDRDPEEENVDSRVDNVIDSLKSPVPTVPGASTSTPTRAPTNTPDPLVTPTETLTPSPTPISSRTPTPTHTDVPTAGPTSTSGPSPTPTGCSATPLVIIVTPDNGAHYHLDEQLPGRALAYDPDNASPTCATVTPVPNGDGIDHVDFEIKSEASGWSKVHFMDQSGVDYCAFDDGAPCNLHNLSTGLWPDDELPGTPVPIELGRHKLYARAQDDDGSWSAWEYVEFWIDPSIITVENISSSEGSGLTFTVTLDYGVPSPFTVDVSLTDVTAIGGATPVAYPEDYDNVVATLNFSGTTGETELFTVDTLDDAVLEGTETFTVSLSASSSYVVDTDTATGTITDNDSAAVTVDSVSVTEGAGMLFTVTLDNAVQSAFNVNVSLGGGSATGGAAPLVAPEDYDNVVTALSFSGTAGETRQFTVATLDDSTVETTETFTVSLSATNPLVTDSGTGTGTLTDNDAPACPVFNITGSSDDDGQEVWFDVDNTLAVSAAITRIKLDWGSGDLNWIKLDGTMIWNTTLSSPIDISSGWLSSTVIDPSPSKELRFRLSSSISGNYDVEVYSSIACSDTFTHDGD